MQDGHVESTGRISCDVVLMSGGYTPSVHLFSQSRGKLRVARGAVGIYPGTVRRMRTHSAGACRGIYDLEAVLADGAAAGAAAASAPSPRGAAPRAAPAPQFQAPQQATSGPLPQATAAERAKNPSSIGSTMSPPGISRSRPARVFSPLNTSSATPPPAWPRIRARPRI